MKNWSGMMKNIVLLSQFGLSLIMPLLLCVGACWLLQTKAGFGVWVFLPGFVLGLGSSGMTGWKFFQAVLKKEEKSAPKEKRGLSFNRHD